MRFARGGLRFLDADVESGFRLEQAEIGRTALRLSALIALVISSGALVVQLSITAGQFGHPMTLMLVACIVLILLFLALALRLPLPFQPRLAAAFALGCGLSVAVASPLVIHGQVPLEMLIRYGYFGPVLVTMLPFLLLRMRAVPGSILNLLMISCYLSVISAIGGFPRLDWLLHAQNILFAAFAAGAGGWLLERLSRANHAHRLQLAANERQLAALNREAEALLLNILPYSIACRLRGGESPIADRADAVTVVFADLVGFTPYAAQRPADEVVRLLDAVFRRFDDIAALHGLEKIKTIGDAYVAVAGLPTPRNDHAAIAADFALAIRDAAAAVGESHGVALAMRIGLESGPAVAGVIGRHKFSYDLWGDTVNTASRMESHGEPGRVHVGEAASRLLADSHALEARGPVAIKGKAAQKTSWLLGAPGRASV